MLPIRGTRRELMALRRRRAALTGSRRCRSRFHTERCAAERLPFLNGAVLLGLFVVLAGCQRLESGPIEGQMKELNATREKTAKFAGTVTIDGKIPRDAINNGLYIMLYDPKKPPAPSATPLKTIVGRPRDGAFRLHDVYPRGRRSRRLLLRAVRGAQAHHDGQETRLSRARCVKTCQRSGQGQGQSGVQSHRVDARKIRLQVRPEAQRKEQAANTGPHAVTQFVN